MGSNRNRRQNIISNQVAEAHEPKTYVVRIRELDVVYLVCSTVQEQQ